MVDLRKLGALVLLVLVFLNPVLDPAWVVLLGAIVAGLGILQGLGVLEIRYLVALENFLVLVLVFLLRGRIRILRNLRPGLGLESVLKLESVL